MLSLKKGYRDEMLQLALILSLLRVNPDTYFDSDLYSNVADLDLENGTSWRSFGPSVLRHSYVHPKSLDSVLLNYEREVFADLNSLGRYNRIESIQNQNITAYLLNVDRTPIGAESHGAEQPIPSLATTHQNENEGSSSNTSVDESTVDPLSIDIELTQEEMDLIEVLWKQDVDLGFSLEQSGTKPSKPEDSSTPTTSLAGDDDIEKLKALKALNDDAVKIEPDSSPDRLDQWGGGINYTIDTETGEYVIKGELDEPLSAADCGPSCELPLGDLSLPLPEFLLEEALQLVGLDDDTPQEGIDAKEIENIPLVPVPERSPAGPVGTETVAAATGESPISPDATSSLKDIDSDDELGILSDMIQTTQFHHPHHRAFQSRMPFVRTVSMEQRWQDLANLLSLPSPSDAGAMPHPFSHHHPLHNYTHSHSHSVGYGPDAARGVLLHNATLAPPMGDINGSVPYSNIGGTNLGNAVATSMNLTNSSEPMGESNATPHYKLEPSHDMMYYQNASSELNQTDGFLSSILNDEDLQLMDMAMNEGMYTMRMLESNNAISNLSVNGVGATAMSRADMERMENSSDSAVSSMGSERVPSLSDGEWCDGGSDSGHTAGDHYVVDYPTHKYRPYDYSYTSRQHANALANSDTARLPPVAQKKHQMFGKRCFQEQGSTSAVPQATPTPIKYEYRDPCATPSYNSPSQAEGAVGPKPQELKYSCSIEFGRHNPIGRSPIDHVQHNHTYHLPAENTGAMQRPVSRDKSKSRKIEDEHITRDEKRARSLSVPIAVEDIINLPMDEFNERLSKYDLSEPQLSLIRDIRRRGKNKVAAQNCRKRKLDQILSLADEVKEIRDRKSQLVSEHDYMIAERQRVKDKYQQLYRHVFQNLRDPDGNPYSPYQYSLQTSADGSILIVPRSNNSLPNSERKDPPPPGRKE